MKKAILSLAVLTIVVMSAFTSLNKPAVYKIDATTSTIAWLGKKVSGQHDGNIKISDGTLNVDGNVVKGGVVNIDMTSITNNDLTDKGYNEKLVGHLKADDFFGVEKFPKAKFVITKIAPNAKAAGKNSYDVTGKLTIKGITKDVAFPATVVVTGNKLTVDANFKLDRTKWDIKYGSDLIGTAADKVIYNDFEITLKIVAAK